MLKKSSKMLMTAAATVLGVALAAGGAYAATGSLTTLDAPGRVMQVSGVGPASEHASENGLIHANPRAPGLFGKATAQDSDPNSTENPSAKDKARKAASDKAAGDKAAGDKAAGAKAAGDKPAKAAAAPDKAGPRKSSAPAKGDDIKSARDSSGHVDSVEPDDAVEVEHASDDDDDSDDDGDSGGSGTSGDGSGKSGKSGKSGD